METRATWHFRIRCYPTVIAITSTVIQAVSKNCLRVPLEGNVQWNNPRGLNLPFIHYIKYNEKSWKVKQFWTQKLITAANFSCTFHYKFIAQYEPFHFQWTLPFDYKYAFASQRNKSYYATNIKCHTDTAQPAWFLKRAAEATIKSTLKQEW